MFIGKQPLETFFCLKYLQLGSKEVIPVNYYLRQKRRIALEDTSESAYSYNVCGRFSAIVELNLVPFALFIYFPISAIVDFSFSR